MSEKSKFLVLNPNPSNLDGVLAKANLQNTKNGPFDAVLLLGDVLPHSSSVPESTIQAATYFTQGKNSIVELDSIKDAEESNLVDIKENLTYMKALVNVVKFASGATIMALSGIAEDAGNHEEVLKLIKENKLPIDILITYNWPRAIASQEKLLLVGDTFINEVTKLVKPRYHFAVGHEHGKFLENKPFKWDSGEYTRFLSLGQEGSGDKWFYAFALSKEVQDIPTEQLTVNPFIAEQTEDSKKRTVGVVEGEGEGKETIVKRAKKVVSPDQCFFCLSNPNTETHMIISIASHTYMTIAKGPLTRSNKYLPFSGHAIILPIEHIASLRVKSDNVTETVEYKEIQQYQKSLVQAFQKNNTFYRLVFFEINRLDNVHQSIQVVPIPEYLVEKFSQSLDTRVKSNNERFEHNHKLTFHHYNDDKDPEFITIMNEFDHIIFTIYTSEENKDIYVAKLTDNTKSIDLQFPRRVLAHLLNMPKRVYWEKCQQPKQKETIDCEEFKKFYHNFDFTLR
ncbi:CwfJ C-terminus 1-domain-containing protein-like protein [Scheffersomyces xylosifermentans]|uniref:CwfJ C-terminus 1-domain-containing protein-like protein n=1 Tax=Scheffersomyces xylosifermentans TaxID=1304137 RepID=UPI00315DB8DE